MKHLDPKSIAVLLLLGLVVWLAADKSARAVQDGGGGDHDRGLIAVTGTFGSGASALYLIDTRTRHLAAYRVVNGRELEFVAARDCTFDFYLESYNDRSAPEMMPSALRRSWTHYNQRAEKAFPGEPAGASPEEALKRKRPGVLPPPTAGEGEKREHKDK